MVGCFVPGCSHFSDKKTCSFYRFPTNPASYRKWVSLIRRADRQPGPGARVCSCHFKGDKEEGPVMFPWNKDRLFDIPDYPPKKKTKQEKDTTLQKDTIQQKDTILQKDSNQEKDTTLQKDTKLQKDTIQQKDTKQEKYTKLQKDTTQQKDTIQQKDTKQEKYTKLQKDTTQQKDTIQQNEIKEKLNLKLNALILENELTNVKRELEDLKKQNSYSKALYTVSNLNPRVLNMETGLSLDNFNLLVDYIGEDKNKINYNYGWKIEKISLPDQILIILMKLRHNYNNLHLAQLFNCCVTTIANIVVTFINVLYEFLYVDLMKAVPSRYKDPNLVTSSSPFCKLSTESVFDEKVVEDSGVLNHVDAGDPILANKGTPIDDIEPPRDSVDIPPFLRNGKFTESKTRLLKRISTYRVHVEKENGRLKEFKILNSIPLNLRPHTDKIVTLCAVLVNLQNAASKDTNKTKDLE